MCARRRTAFVVAFVFALAGLTGAAGAESKPQTNKTVSFGISGGAAQLFAPGMRQSLDLTITNPYDAPLTLTSVSVTVQDGTTVVNTASVSAGCSGLANLSVVPRLPAP